MCRSIGGVDRTLSRYRRVAAEAAILRHAVPVDAEAEANQARSYEVRDGVQLRGAPVIILKTPAWPREDWAEPQRRRVRRSGA